METQNDMARDERRETSERMRRAATRETNQNEKLARQLSNESMRNWQRSVEGMLALPTAAALGIASGTLYLASLVTRSFELLQQSTIAIREGMEQARRDPRDRPDQQDGGAMSSEGGTVGRSNQERRGMHA